MTIVVVGAGIVGCALAHELASRGVRVQVIDSRGTGEGATRASAGTLAPYIEGHLAALRTLGVRSLRLFDEFVHRAIEDSGERVEYVKAGTLQVARQEADLANLAAAAATLAADDVSHQLLDGPAARTIEPGLGEISGGLLIPEHAHVAVQALTRALIQAAVTRGAAATTGQVIEVRQAGNGAEVVTAETTIGADAVIIAAGSWSSELRTQNLTTTHHPPSTIQPHPPPAIKPHPTANHEPPTTNQIIRPIRGQLVHLRLDDQPISRVVWGSECYVVPWRDGSLLVGATVEDVGFDESVTPEAVRLLARAAAALVPAARGARIHEVRVGLRPRTADGLPVIGRSSTMPSVFYATGHYRTGVLLAPLTAALLADLIVDGRDDQALALVRPDRLGL